MAAEYLFQDGVHLPCRRLHLGAQISETLVPARPHHRILRKSLLLAWVLPVTGEVIVPLLSCSRKPRAFPRLRDGSSRRRLDPNRLLPQCDTQGAEPPPDASFHAIASRHILAECLEDEIEINA